MARILKTYANGARLVITERSGALGACERCGRDKPGVYLTGGGVFACRECARESDIPQTSGEEESKA